MAFKQYEVNARGVWIWSGRNKVVYLSKRFVRSMARALDDKEVSL